jgi:hypothetical protein
MPRIRQGLAVVAAVTAFCACTPTGNAYSLQKVSLHAAFFPDRLGASTTVAINFTIATTNGQVPPPATEVNFHLPAGMALANSTLGLVTCDIVALEIFGLSGCSPNAVIGTGEALVEVPFGPDIIKETVKITALMGHSENKRTAVLFDAEGSTPVAAQVIFPGKVFDDTPPYGLLLKTVIPLTPSLPGAPDAAVVRMRSYIGPRDLTYYRRVHQRRVPYGPQGMSVPLRCPAGGFQMAADFSFQDGTSASARTAIPCPPRRKG